MTEKELFRFQIKKIIDGDMINMRVSVNGSDIDKSINKPYTISEVIIIIQALASINHHYIEQLSQILMGTVETDRTKYPDRADQK